MPIPTIARDIRPVTSDLHHPELTLVAAMIQQAIADLRLKEHRRAARDFFSDRSGMLSRYCEMLGLEVSAMQRGLRTVYPELR